MENSELLNRIEEAVEILKPDYIAALKELVRIPSVVGSEKCAQNFMEDMYLSAGLETVRFTADLGKLKGHPAFMDSLSSSYENRPNIIGLSPCSVNGPSLILNGHVDVVSPKPLQAWSRDPWGGEIEGDRLYGRGAGDMKAGLLANYFALKAILKAGLKVAGPVMLQSVVDEEAGGIGGTLACLNEGYTADGMVVTEPHNLNVTISHAGINYFRVKVKGKTAHAGLAHLGVNAIGKMYHIYHALEELDLIRGREIHFPLYEKGSGRSCHLNIGTMQAGGWPSTVAGSAVLECRIGYVPGEKMSDIKKLVETVIMAAAEKDPWLCDHPPEIEWFGWCTDPWYQDPHHPLVQMLRGAAQKVLDRPVELIGRASGNDGRFSQYFNMPAACTGPVANNIHGVDEYVEIPSAIELIKILAVFIIDWCGLSK